jgi:hypothetical protein
LKLSIRAELDLREAHFEAIFERLKIGPRRLSQRFEIGPRRARGCFEIGPCCDRADQCFTQRSCLHFGLRRRHASAFELRA